MIIFYIDLLLNNVTKLTLFTDRCVHLIGPALTGVSAKKS